MQKLSQIMSRDVKVVPPSCTVQEAAEQMRTLDIGALPVCDGQKLLGMVTDRDIAIRSCAKGHDPKGTKISEIMSSELTWCFEDSDVRDVARLMQQKEIRRIPIVDREKKLVGIRALADLANSSASDSTKSDGLQGVSQK